MSEKHIIIIGGGIIGCTTAYYLTRHPSSSSITLIEASKHGPGQGASGKAGGLVAKWAYPKEIVDVSFEEHVKLAKEHNGKERWGWRYVNCGSWEGRGEVLLSGEQTTRNKSLEKSLGLPGGGKPTQTHKFKKGLPADLTWVKKDLTNAYTPMATDGATAQVHPYQFTTSMFELAKAKGLNYVNGRVTQISQEKGKVTGIQYLDQETQETKTICATQVILSAGAWSPRILADLPIDATRAHSITIHPKDGVSISPYVLFTEISDPLSGTSSSPEIYARPDNEVYACGPGDDCSLPDSVDDVVVDQAACHLIHKHVSSISKELREGEIDKQQACFLPVVCNGGGPIIDEATSIARGLFIGTGHTCWVRTRFRPRVKRTNSDLACFGLTFNRGSRTDLVPRKP